MVSNKMTDLKVEIDDFQDMPWQVWDSRLSTTTFSSNRTI